jgi:hypothetical protein
LDITAINIALETTDWIRLRPPGSGRQLNLNTAEVNAVIAFENPYRF